MNPTKTFPSFLAACLFFCAFSPLLNAAPPTHLGSSASTNVYFTNPVAAKGADPWVILHDGTYFFCQNRFAGIQVNRCSRLQDLGADHWKLVWAPEAGKPYSKDLWAPELHFIRGQWWIYVAADDGNNFHHRMYVLEGSTNDPQAPFKMKGELAAPTDRWAIDGTVLQMPGNKLYFIWSGWEGLNNVAQNLYIAPMSNPWTISGERVMISKPELKWECHGTPLINEGPEALWNGNKLFLIYSASGSWGDNYCLGQLTWTGGDPLNASSWMKKQNAVFSRTKEVFGPGHCSFVKSQDGKEDWIIYHSARRSGSGWNRQVNIQRFEWDADGSPNFGRPIPACVPQKVPSVILKASD